MSEEMQDVTPTQVDTSTETGESVVDVSSESATGQEADNQPEQQQDEGQKKKGEWVQKRISEITRQKWEATRQAEEARAEAEQYRQQLAQYQQSQEYQPQHNDQVDVQALARQEAAKMLAEKTFNDQCNAVYSAGKAEFQDFDQSVANLQMVGANREFLELATTTDAGHKLIHHLGSDLDEAARILSLPPVQMARELTKLEMKLSQPVSKPVSKAPEPIKPIGTGKATSEGLSDDLPIEEWMRREREMRNRR